MKINYNVTGSERKRLVGAISKITEVKPKYLGMPSMAYEIGDITVDKEGALICEDDTKAERIAHDLIADGFTAADDTTESATEEVEVPESLTISVPKDGFTDESIANLNHLVESKATLIKKALGVEDLTITAEDDKISFPWFTGFPAPDEISTYVKFIGKVCHTIFSENTAGQGYTSSGCATPIYIRLRALTAPLSAPGRAHSAIHRAMYSGV